ncbi:SLAC1 family transporter [Tabrizicola caldifontis]|uniref:SLAC1 family transporter n=1 Tax=Tabrizicola caldifontis TaxID=2528036 RepID=UPI001080AF42|nr:tellurium resistance protein [Rhodobacter sp. YIM 73028]
MTPSDPRLDARPKRYPPPEFPPRQPALFARTPPALFPPALGLLGLAIALRMALGRLGWDQAPGDLLAGVAVALWGFATVAWLAKVARRPGVVVEDLRVLPGRAGLAAMTMGGMAAAALLAPHAAQIAKVLLVAALSGHLVLALLLIRLLVSLPPPGREVNPTWNLSFVGFIVAAPPALALGWADLAAVLFWGTLPVAVAIWVMSGLQFLRVTPPAVLRPLLAIHISPAALFATTAALMGMPDIAAGFVALAAAFAAVLVLSWRWLGETGISPLWGAFTFPLAALATAMLVKGGGWQWVGFGLVGGGLVAIPLILWWVWKLWPGGRLAAITNAAEA